MNDADKKFFNLNNFNKREEEYFDYLDKLTISEFNSKITKEINDIFISVRNPKRIVVKNDTGIFRKTKGCVKCSSGVKFGEI